MVAVVVVVAAAVVVAVIGVVVIILIVIVNDLPHLDLLLLSVLLHQLASLLADTQQ